MSSGLVDEMLARVRRATPADNALLLELMAHVPMEGSLAVATRRDPDFFALYDLQRGAARSFVYDDGAMQGTGTILVRDGFLDGRAQPVGYLGDLRIRGASRARRGFPFAFGRFFDDVVQETGCESFLTAVIASNAVAIRSLSGRKAKTGRAAQPYYHPYHRYEMASVQLVLPRRPRTVSGVDVRTATPDDVGPIAAFLANDHAQRPFGWRFDDGELEHRLARWPGFSLDDTFVARAARDNGGGRVVGVCTAWDPAPVKRYRVVRYARDMRLVKAAVDVASLALRCPRLPAVGEDFRSLYLTNLTVAGDDPAVGKALLEAVYQHAWRARVHFFSLPLYDFGGRGDPLAPALDGFIVRKLAFQLFAVTSSRAPRTDWPAGRPGFEMALA